MTNVRWIPVFFAAATIIAFGEAAHAKGESTQTCCERLDETVVCGGVYEH